MNTIRMIEGIALGVYNIVDSIYKHVIIRYIYKRYSLALRLKKR